MRRVNWLQFRLAIERAETRLLEQIRTQQVTIFTPAQIAAVYPNGYDCSTVPRRTKLLMDLEESAILRTIEE